MEETLDGSTGKTQENFQAYLAKSREPGSAQITVTPDSEGAWEAH